MRWLVIALVIAACDAGERAKPPPPPVPAPPPTPAPTPTPEPAGIELVHHVPGVTVAVSSQVKNPRILPAHLIDHDLQTAWNSRTGRLAGSWLEVRAPGSRIRELRMTVGHTGKGPRGEDYFMMNPRIVKVAIDSSVEAGRVVTLDPESRELQTIGIAAAEWVRITVIEARPGTKRSWREIAVSELEAWGQPPQGWQAGGTAPAPAVNVGGDRGDFCVEIEAINARRDEETKEYAAHCKLDERGEEIGCPGDTDGRASCGDRPVPVRGLAPPWPAPLRTCDIFDNNFGPSECWVTLETPRAIVLARSPVDNGDPLPDEPDAYMKDIVKGGPPELVLRDRLGEQKPDDPVVICRLEPLSCTAPEPAKTALSHPPVFR